MPSRASSQTPCGVRHKLPNCRWNPDSKNPTKQKKLVLRRGINLGASAECRKQKADRQTIFQSCTARPGDYWDHGPRPSPRLSSSCPFRVRCSCPARIPYINCPQCPQLAPSTNSLSHRHCAMCTNVVIPPRNSNSAVSGWPRTIPVSENTRITLCPFRLLSAIGIHRRFPSDWNPPG
jgi:hypothetical protein